MIAGVRLSPEIAKFGEPICWYEAKFRTDAKRGQVAHGAHPYSEAGAFEAIISSI